MKTLLNIQGGELSSSFFLNGKTNLKIFYRYRDDRGEERVRLDQERRSHELPNGAVLNLSKSGLDHGSVGELSDPGDHSRDPSVQDEEDILSDVNVSDIDDKDEGKEFWK